MGLSWLEVSLRLRPELAEPAAELLGRVAIRGVAIESIDEQVQVRAWIPNDDNLEGRRSEIERGLWHLSQIVPYPKPAFKLVDDEDWEAVWKRSYRPLEVGSRLLVLPSWSAEVDDERVVIYLEPGMAFGTGAHPTTRHCLQALEQLVEPGFTVLDLGCGSGILAIAAAAFGARSVCAADVDRQAVRLSIENAARNGFSRAIGVIEGSLEDVPRDQTFEVIVANIRASVVREMLLNGLTDYASPGGAIVISGILEPQIDEVLAAARSSGAQLSETLSTDDWRTLVLKANPLPNSGAG